jgi:hypothetical protein
MLAESTNTIKYHIIRSRLIEIPKLGPLTLSERSPTFFSVKTHFGGKNWLQTLRVNVSGMLKCKKGSEEESKEQEIVGWTFGRIIWNSVQVPQSTISTRRDTFASYICSSSLLPMGRSPWASLPRRRTNTMPKPSAPFLSLDNCR